jgi:GTP-binding protein LepA
MQQESHIRNFVIIAHVDHGKSTLADRFLELTATVPPRKFRAQFLDQMELERERGITIKMQPVRMRYGPYTLNLIDTPGHADFSYEVSRSLAAVEGAILLVDGREGLQAETYSKLELAKHEGLTVIGAINKIDLHIPDCDALARELAALIGTTPDEIFRISAKTGEGVAALLEAVTTRIRPPERPPHGACAALIFDSKYDPYRGIIAYVRVKSGELRKGVVGWLVASRTPFEVVEVGYFAPELSPSDTIRAGEIGYVATGLKEPRLVRVGDTVATSPDTPPLPGYREPQPVLFAGFYPPAEEEFDQLNDSLSKLQLNDAALTFVQDFEGSLGKGFRIGFLGTLHMEIVKERLAREYGIEPLITLPSVRYRAVLQDGSIREITAPRDLPPRSQLREITEPWADGEIIVKSSYLGQVLALLKKFRGIPGPISSLERERVMLKFSAPLAELIAGFYDALKGISHGYASLTYEVRDWKAGDLVKLEILIAGQPREELARILPRASAERVGRATVVKLKTLLPRELFEVPLQAAVEGRIIARETIPALRKDVTAHLYGGDRTRKMKLWKNQARGKKRLRERGSVEVAPKVFFELLKYDVEGSFG